jgi:HEAT repeat protein
LPVILALAGDGASTPETARITKADIPANVSPELRGLLEELVAADSTLDTIESTVRQDGAVKKLHGVRERALPAVPFLVRYAARKNEYQTYAPWEAQAFTAMGERAVEPCLDTIKQLPSKYRKRAVRIFAAANVPWMFDVVNDLRVTDRDPEVRHKAGWELAGRSNPPVLQALILELKDRDPERRRKAVEHFADRHESQALEPLLEALREEPNEDVQVGIIRALGEYHDAHVPPVLTALLRDRRANANVRCQAEFALFLDYESFAFDPLMTVLRDATEDGSLRVVAVEGLQDDARALPLLLEIAKGSYANKSVDPTLQSSAAIGVARIRRGSVDDMRIVTLVKRCEDPFTKKDSTWIDRRISTLKMIASNGTTTAIREAAKAALAEPARRPSQVNETAEIEESGLFVRSAILVGLLLLLTAFWAHLRSRAVGQNARPQQPIG